MGVLTGTLHIAGSRPDHAALNLRAIDNRGVVRIEWNRGAEPIVEASKASLVIVDGGEWIEARLSTQDSIDTWRQWLWEWDAPRGPHLIEVRATDVAGSFPIRADPMWCSENVACS